MYVSGSLSTVHDTTVLNAHNLPKSGLTVHRVNQDGTLGSEVDQPTGLEFGPYPHQVRVAPSGRTVVIADRGNKAERDKPEDPGALKVKAWNEFV